MNLLTIDFEYRNTNEKNYDLVCCAYSYYSKGTLYTTHAEWLHGDLVKKNQIKAFLKGLRDRAIIVCFNAEAEARCFLSLGLNPTKFKWLDLQAEWRMLINYSPYRHGPQLIQGVEKVTTPKINYDDEGDHSKPDASLVACTYKLLGKKEDLAYKKRMIKLILRGKFETLKKKEMILEYCSGDIGNLFEILKEVVKKNKSLLRGNYDHKTFMTEALWRGETVARAAMMAWQGYPINKDHLTNFMDNVPHLIKNLQEDINSQFPKISPFAWNKKTQRYQERQKTIRDWIKDNHGDKWLKTDKGQPSLAIEAWEKEYHFRHHFPEGNFGAQILRYKKFLQSMNGFKPKAINAKDPRTIKSFLDSNDWPRVHPFIQPYGSSTGRYQPSSISFLFLKAAWVRSLCQPKPGKAIVGFDYKSQEFLIAGLVSKDSAMISAYASGDVYLSFAKLAGAVPKDGTKQEYSVTRDRFKSTVLGVSYGMAKNSLASKIEQDTGTPCSVEDAQELIDLFYSTFPDYARWRENLYEEYQEKQRHYIKTVDGWHLFGECYNHRSVLNFPIQGMGAAILRKAIALAQDRKLCPVMPLHDALYCELNSGDWAMVDLLQDTMREAFISCFPGQEADASFIELDGVTWSPDYDKGQRGNLEIKKLYIDPRSRAEYNRFCKYFLPLGNESEESSVKEQMSVS